MVDYVQELWEIHVKVKASGKYNFQECRLQLPSKFNFDFIEQELVDYEDSKIVDMLKFGFPVDCTLKKFNPGIPSNHKGAMEYIDEVKKLVLKEVHLGGFLGPFTTPPFQNPWFSPLNSVPKKTPRKEDSYSIFPFLLALLSMMGLKRTGTWGSIVNYPFPLWID